MIMLEARGLAALTSFCLARALGSVLADVFDGLDSRLVERDRGSDG